MKDYKKIIKSESRIIHQLHENVHATYKNRDNDADSWEKACDKFRSYTSEIESILDRVYEDVEYCDQEILEFVISFLEVDPLFFRSGYIKEEILRKLKRSPISKKQANRLRAVLEHAVYNRGSREYKSYCRLAPAITNKKLINMLTIVEKSPGNEQRNRASLMLKYIDQHTSRE